MAIHNENRFSVGDVFDAASYLLDGNQDADFRDGVISMVSGLVIPEVENDQLARWLIDLALIKSYGA